MASSSLQEITQLLVAWRNGDETAMDQLMPFVYDELRRIAHRHLRKERRGHTLQTSALINEAYLRLQGYRRVKWKERAQFFAASAALMRRILVEYGRARVRVKRGGKEQPISLDTSSISIPDSVNSEDLFIEVLALDEAMTRLEALQPRKGKVVELHFFAGMGKEEIASVLDVHVNTVDRDLVFSRAWLRRELSR